MKRIPRDLKKDLGKYIALFLFMSLMIGFVSGFLVADGSMIRAYNDSFTKYNVENGHFVTESKLTKKAIENIEDEDVKLPALSFAARFRLRIMIQNRSTYLILFSGLFLASVIFLFGSLFDPLLQHYKGLVQESMFCKYQYMLKDKAETESPQAEKFAAFRCRRR